MPFSYESYRDLKKRLGATSALLELNHLAIAELIAAAGRSGDAKNYIETRAKAHGIHVQSSAFAEMSARLSQQSIVVLYEEWEHFLYDFKKESCADNNVKWPQKEDGEDPLDYVVRAIGAANTGPVVLGRFRMALMEFFRLARNCAVHPVNEKYEDYFERPRARILEHAEQIISHYGELPSEYTSFSLKELVLYSRVIKDVALSLCLLAKPTDASMRSAVMLKRFNKIQNNKERYRNALLGELCTRYGLDMEEAAIVLDRGAD